jgi:hypothetical protein
MKLHHLTCLAVVVAAPAAAQGPGCSSAAAIAGTGVFAFDLTGRAPAGPVGSGCPVDTGAEFGDVFWQWTCTTAGDYRFEIATPSVTSLLLYEGSGCGATWRASESGYTYAVEISDRQVGDAVLVQLAQHVNSPDALGTLTVASLVDACSSAADDAFEDNDTPASAVPLGAGSYPGLFVWRGDEDHFRVQVPAAETLRVDWQAAIGNVALRVTDAACSQLAYDVSSPWDWTNTGGAAVDLILNFELRQTGADCTTYDVDVALGPAPCLAGTDDALEPNDTCAAPAPLAVGAYTNLVTRDADPDHYSIVLAPGERLDVVGDSNAVLVAMFDGGCALQSEAARLNDYTNLGPGAETVVFRVRPNGFYSAGCEVYDLAVSVAPNPCAGAPDDAFEDNDTPAQAAPLAVGAYAGLWVSLYDSDHYRVCLAPGGVLQAGIVFPDNVVALDLELLNQPGAQYTYGIDTVDVVFTNQTAGVLELTLRVRVLPILSDCWAYDLSVAGTGDCPPDFIEFCLPPGTNSTGGVTTLEPSLGSGVGSGLHLEALGGPPGQFGYFLVSAGWVEPGGTLGDGRLCLTNPVGRYNGLGGGPETGSIGSFDALGRFTNLAGTSTSGTGFDVPSYVPLIGATITAGDTWSFQLWHRDLNGGVPTVNFSGGVAATF